MKNKIKNILKAFVLVYLVMFQFFGCKQIEDLKDSEKVAYITINNSLARTVNPEASIEKMTNFVLKGTFSGEEEQELGSWANAETLKTAKIPIKPGLWDFKLTAQQGNISFLATIEKKQIEIALNNLEFNLSMSSMDLQNGKGSINISFTGLKNTVNTVIARAFYLDGKTADLFYKYEHLKVDSTGEKNTATLNVSDVPSGTYFIEFEFYYEEYKIMSDYGFGSREKIYHDTKLGTYTELVNVVADCTSSALIENLDLDTHLYKLTYNLNGGFFYENGGYSDKNTYTFSYSSSSNVGLLRYPVKDYIFDLKVWNPVKYYYDFEGWYLESPDELFDGNFQGMTGDKTLYAKWKPGECYFYVDSYYWDYSKNQWEVLLEKQKYYGITEEQLTEERIKEIVFSNDEYKGYVFDHAENLGTIPKKGTVKLYVRPAPCEIVLKLNGGKYKGNTGNITISGYYNQSIDIEDPELDGFCFEKWTPSIPEIFSLEKTEHTASYNSIGKFVEYNDYILAETELTYKAWYSVYQWATSDERGDKKYVFRNPGREGCAGIDGAAPTENSNEPVTNISEADAVLWCNAASEREGLEPLYYEFKKEFSYTASTISLSIEVIRNEADYCYYNRAATGSENGLYQYPMVYNKNSYHLPTSIEWKEMARGTSPTDYLWAGTNSVDELNDYAVTANNSNHKTSAVKTKKANSIGLYDITGNVKEMIMILPREENTYPCKCSYFDTIGGSYRYGFDTSYIYPTINGDGGDYQYGDSYGDLADYGIRISKSKLK